MVKIKREGQNRLVQTTVDDETYRALCERSIVEDRPVASVLRQAVNLYFAHISRIKNVQLD
jgi:hypothetical protein